MHPDLYLVEAALTRFQPLGGQGMAVLVLAPKGAAEGFQSGDVGAPGGVVLPVGQPGQLPDR